MSNTFTLDQFNPNENLNLLLFGESGAGKSCAASQFPSPILWFDFDGKISSVASFHRKNPEVLKGIKVVSLVPTIEYDPIPDFFEETRKLDLAMTLKKPEDLPRTIVIDSLTTFSSALLRHVIKTNVGFKRQEVKQAGMATCMQDYGVLRKMFEKIIPGLLGLPCNIVMLGHIAIEKDEKTGEILRRTKMDGSFATDLPIYFEEVYRLYAEGDKRLVQTVSDGRYNCRTQRSYPDKTPFSYSKLIELRD